MFQLLNVGPLFQEHCETLPFFDAGFLFLALHALQNQFFDLFHLSHIVLDVGNVTSHLSVSPLDRWPISPTLPLGFPSRT